MSKQCTRCLKTKPTDSFNYRDKVRGTRQSHCHDCSRLYTREHYAHNKSYYYKRNSNKRKLLAKWLRDYKSTLKCERCNENHPACLHFHHKDPSIKNYCVSAMSNHYSLTKLTKEIAKCSVLCANCHAKLHYK